METTLINLPGGQFLHGGDYNPEQWLDQPDILEKDLRMLVKAGCNTVTLGVFSWSTLEPTEGSYQFQWLEEIIDRLYAHGIYTILGTPSGARPRWMAQKYPEVLRTDKTGRKALFGERHNHCFTSPVYREKVAKIDKLLAEHFANHPAILLWHISNEFGGECYCDLCQDAFRSWLKKRYKTVDELNRRWSTTFWSHTYQGFDQVEPPSPLGDNSLHGLNLDWRRFITDQTIDFMTWEIQALREAGAKGPMTTNMMYYHNPLNYREFAKTIDVISWDNYPKWHCEKDSQVAEDCGMYHDIMRGLKKQPFLLMENSPGVTNWQSVSKVKKPGMHRLSALHAMAHGADAILYFQVRQSRGASEKFHGAMIDHYGGESSRTYRDVVQVGEDLQKLREIRGAKSPAQVAIVYDWENIWAMEDAMGPRNTGLHYKEAVLKSYHAFKKQGMNVDFIGPEDVLEDYRIVAAPMMYMMTEAYTEKVKAYVKNGGIYISTYWSGIVDENDRCYLGGTPYNLMDVFGIRSKEIDALCDHEENVMEPVQSTKEAFGRSYVCKNLCDIVALEGATPLLVYGSDFYKDEPACTVNDYGRGKGYYICADGEQAFYDDLYLEILKEAQVTERIHFPVAEDVEVNIRQKDEMYYIFIQNFGTTPRTLDSKLTEGEVLLGGDVTRLEPYETLIIKTKNLM